MPSHDEIAQRAYELYQQRGCQPGHEMEDWLEAQRQLSAQSSTGETRHLQAQHRKKPARMSTVELEEGTNPWEHALPRRPNATRSL